MDIKIGKFRYSTHLLEYMKTPITKVIKQDLDYTDEYFIDSKWTTIKLFGIPIYCCVNEIIDSGQQYEKIN